MINKSLLFKIALLFIVTIVGSRFSGGYFLAFVVLGVLVAPLEGRNGWALLGYIMLPVIFFLNESIIGVGSMAPLIARLAIIVLPFAFIVQGVKICSCTKVPIGGIILYLACAGLSSVTGWMPLISYFKILNFLLFILGLKLGVQNINGNIKDIDIIRHGLIVIASFIILGSLASYLFPSIGYSMEISNARQWGAYGTDEEIGRDLVHSGTMILFSGVLRHSQLLAPMSVMLFTWVLCDMIFVVRRVSWIHGVILLATPILLYLTKSRTGLFALGVAMIMIMLYAMKRVILPRKLKSRLTGVVMVVCVLIGVGGAVAEIRTGAMTKWILKWNAESTSNISFIESVSSTRMGLVDKNMHDFQQNPLFGMGFQVVESHRYLYNQGKISIISAPIEKGVLPMMILGEGGLVGALVFAIFLLGFYGYYMKKRYVVTVTLFTTFLATNIGEASFFSPGGHGGFYWLISIAGGMSVDYLSQFKSNMQFNDFEIYENTSYTAWS